MALTTLENQLLALSVDEVGRVVRFKNKRTGSELIGFPEAAGAWRMLLPSGRHTMDFIDGSRQKPTCIQLREEGGRRMLELHYDGIRLPDGSLLPIKAVFTFWVEGESGPLEAGVKLDNRGARRIEEVEFPIIGGMQGFKNPDGKLVMELIYAINTGVFHGDVLNTSLPEVGREWNDYACEHETAMFEADRGGTPGRELWVELYGQAEGLSVIYQMWGEDFAVKLEHFPKCSPHRAAHFYPPGTPRWIRLFGLHVPRLAPGGEWTSSVVTLAPHGGDWHAGADLFSARRHKALQVCRPPEWLRGFAGWTEILGKTYLGECYHDFAKCAADVVRDKNATGLDFVFYYGHTALGAEGADFSQEPAADLGGLEEFRKMIEKLHQNGIRVMLLDHFHRYVNRDVPEFRELNLERFAAHDESGQPYVAKWWKTTFLSCRRLDGPTPRWLEMCPACEEYLAYYLKHISRMIELGVDALELDVLLPNPCFNPAHKHAPGDMFEHKRAFLRAVREHARRLNPDFALLGETMSPETLESLNGFYPDRYMTEDGRIHRYLYPEARIQAVKVTNYNYDAVNKAVSLGLGVETEIWGLRKTTLAACPELAAYIGEVNRFRRKYPEIMLHGTFRDTVGAKAGGQVLFSVLEGKNGSRALVLRNPTPNTMEARAEFSPPGRNQVLKLWQPFKEEQTLKQLPGAIPLPPFGLAVALSLGK